MIINNVSSKFFFQIDVMKKIRVNSYLVAMFLKAGRVTYPKLVNYIYQLFCPFLMLWIFYVNEIN